MKVKQITLDDEEMPERVMLDCSHDEALLIAALIGKASADKLDILLPEGARVGAEIFDALTGGVFNRFYEDGVNEAIGTRQVRS